MRLSATITRPEGWVDGMSKSLQSGRLQAFRAKPTWAD